MISELIRALKAGEELKNAETWKNLQATAGACTALAGAAVMVLGWVGIHLQVTAEQYSAIVGGIAGVLGVFNGYATLATSRRVGLPSGGGDSGDSIDP